MDTIPVSPSLLVGIFADDLTGALDAAAPFAARGLKTLVSPTLDLPEGANSAAVVSINLGTRHTDPGDFASTVSTSVRALSALGPRVLLNKIDSTMRGNPGAELVMAMRLLDADRALLCPAYPQNGRTVEGGVLLVKGVPVADTDVGQDLLSPLSSSRVTEILRLSLRSANRGEGIHISRGIGDWDNSDKYPVLVLPDSKTPSDMQMLARLTLGPERPALLSGSAGLAIGLAGALSREHPSSRSAQSRNAERIIVITASQREIVDRQLSVLARQFDLSVVEVPVDEVLDGISSTSLSRLTGGIAARGIGVLRLGRPNVAGGSRPSDVRSMAGAIVTRLGLAVREIVDAGHPDAIVVIGGDTASGILEACGVSSIELRGELQPGTVAGIPVDGTIAGTLLVTRAGGFGDENSLVELVSLLRSDRAV